MIGYFFAGLLFWGLVALAIILIRSNAKLHTVTMDMWETKHTRITALVALVIQ